MSDKKVHFAEDVYIDGDKTEKNIINDSMPIESFYVDLINNYTEYYKKINNKKKLSLLEGINDDDPTSTNKQLENFYEEMCLYNIYEKTNPENIKIYEYDDKKNQPKLGEKDNLYGIMKNGEIQYISLSLFSLLIELTNLKIENKEEKFNNNYDIVTLK